MLLLRGNRSPTIAVADETVRYRATTDRKKGTTVMAEPSRAGEASARLSMDAVCDRFEAAWKAGQQPRIEDFLDAAPAADRPRLLRELLALELGHRSRLGYTLD